ncbi:MAG: hypothetical protein C4555_07335 [Dehalococcoidia bacterium]|nr:MAG: hypothetical protein C4555_07335 [Dehalococcoidia bacterium]
MTRKYKLVILAVSLVAVLVTAIATTALAAPKVPAAVATPTEADYAAWGCPVAGGNYQVIADLLGMTTEEIEAELQQGKSLVEIAASKGVSEDDLVAAILATMREFMQGHVTAGYWTQAQLESRLQFAEQHIRQLVNASGASYGYGGYGCGGNGGMMGGWGTGNTNRGSFGRGGMMGGWGTGNTNRGSFGRGGMMGGWY